MQQPAEPELCQVFVPRDHPWEGLSGTCDSPLPCPAHKEAS